MWPQWFSNALLLTIILSNTFSFMNSEVSITVYIVIVLLLNNLIIYFYCSFDNIWRSTHMIWSWRFWALFVHLLDSKQNGDANVALSEDEPLSPSERWSLRRSHKRDKCKKEGTSFLLTSGDFSCSTDPTICTGTETFLIPKLFQ